MTQLVRDRNHRLSQPLILIISPRCPASPFISDPPPGPKREERCRSTRCSSITPGMAWMALFRFLIDCPYRLSLVRGTFAMCSWLPCKTAPQFQKKCFASRETKHRQPIKPLHSSHSSSSINVFLANLLVRAEKWRSSDQLAQKATV